MNVINGGLFPRQMLEYIHEAHPYVHVVHGICGDRDKFFEGKRQPYGQYQERKYHIVINFGKMLYGTLFCNDSLGLRWDNAMSLEAFSWFDVLGTVIHECRHAWQEKVGVLHRFDRNKSYIRQPCEIDARDYTIREMYRLSCLSPSLFMGKTATGIIHIRCNDYHKYMLSRQDEDVNHPCQIYFRTNMIRMLRNSNCHIPVTKRYFTKEGKRIVSPHSINVRTPKKNFRYVPIGTYFKYVGVLNAFEDENRRLSYSWL